jgi:hypothetical protein
MYQKKWELLDKLKQVAYGVVPDLQRLKDVAYTLLKTVSGIWTLEQQWRPMDQQKKKKDSETETVTSRSFDRP